METTTPETSQTIALNKSLITNHPFGFELKPTSRNTKGDLAKVIASSFIRFCNRSDIPLEESVEQFMGQYRLFNELLNEADQFLQDDIAILMNNQPINELLIKFATYRLGKMSRAYYYESLTVRDPEDVAGLKARVKLYQQDFDCLLQSI